MSFMPAALRRLLRRAAILAFAVFVGGAVGVVANARAQPARDGIRPGRSVLVLGDTNHVLVGRRSLAGVAGVNLVGLAPKTLRRATTGR